MPDCERPRESRREVTALLLAWANGESAAAGELVVLVYDELRGLAARHRRRLGAGGTMSTTALVHEAFLKLAAHERCSLADRRHFFAVAARAMRQLLIDDARRHGAAKRGGELVVVPLDEGRIADGDALDVDMLDLDRALGALSRLDPRLAEIVELRYFAGLTVEETAELQELSTRTIMREWQKARLYLHRALSAQRDDAP
jgi:RNA polymerase sigma factor (TIGR02999 family)